MSKFGTWTRPDEELPKSGQPVLVRVKDDRCNYWLRAEYAAQYTLGYVEGDFGVPGWVAIHPETEEEFCPVGWYESNENEEVHWQINDEVTGWMPGPEVDS